MRVVVEEEEILQVQGLQLEVVVLVVAIQMRMAHLELIQPVVEEEERELHLVLLVDKVVPVL